jgi:hypothetical protein
MLLELITKYKVGTSCAISYNNQVKEKFVIAKFIVLFPTYILFILCEFDYLQHVHTCIDNFESFIFLIINDFFVSRFYCMNVTKYMY